MPTDTPIDVVENPPQFSSHGAAAPLPAVLDAIARPDLYAANPFRFLGVPLTASVRDVARRADELKMAAKLGTDERNWAFAPSTAPDEAVVREAVQGLKDGVTRVLAEFFWFWPENFPDAAGDAAIDALARGEIEPAYGVWLGSKSGVAAHNLAVLHHFAALDREQENGPFDDEAGEWWNAAVEHWSAVVAADDVWLQLGLRIEQLADPRIPAGFADELRLALPRLLARVSARAAAARAARRELDEARKHAALVRRFCSHHADAARVLAESVESAVKVAGLLVEETGRKVAQPDADVLDAVVHLLGQTESPLDVIGAVTGDDSELYLRTASQVVECAAGALALLLRRSQSAKPVLPWVFLLETIPVSVEVAKRRSEVAAQVRDAVVAENLEAAGAAAGDLHARFEAELQAIFDEVAPAADQQLAASGRRGRYVAGVRRTLIELGRTAAFQLEEFDLSGRALGLAAEMSDEDGRVAVLRERTQLRQQFSRRRAVALRLERNGHVLEMDSTRIVLDGVEVRIEEITGVRFGSSGPGADGLAGLCPKVAWCTAQRSVELDSLNFLDLAAGLDERYQEIVEALEACVVPLVADRLIRKVHAGQSVVFGESALRPEGLVLRRRPGSAERSEVVPYADVNCFAAGGDLLLAQSGRPDNVVRYGLADVWNAVLIEGVIARLASGA